ncbi:hypothetical protein E4H12_10555 [Candidatus Thorarchaeota archaeon]|nr:MAG: hypothetical protein E4H12_10555 [Candidatus Thorarchaeota archaeon]
MAKLKINPLSLILFSLSGILLLMVQLGVVSPGGLIDISLFQYTWVFWFTVVFFIIATANLVVRIPSHAKWSTGYSGTITRTVKIAGIPKDYFIKGAGGASIKKVLHDDWPFKEIDHNSNWHVVDELGNDVTNDPISSLDGIAIVVIDENAT